MKFFMAQPLGYSIQTAEIDDLAVTNAKIANTTITDAKISATAAIAKTKLASLDIVNADVNAAAAIAKTKLASLDIVNADVNAAAAIDVTKLAKGTALQQLRTNAGATAVEWATISAGGGDGQWIPVIMYSAIIQGTFAINQDATNYWNLSMFQNTSDAVNDEINYSVWLNAGTYTFDILHSKGTNNAIITAYIDADSVGTIDTYNAATQYNQRGTLTGFVVATSGLKTLKIKSTSKNGASTGYKQQLYGIRIFRTA